MSHLLELPLFEAIPYQNPLDYFGPWAHQPGALLLHSGDYALAPCAQNRYSYLMVAPPLAQWTLREGKWADGEPLSGNPFSALRAGLSWGQIKHPDLPPFQGGLAGFLAYDLCHYLDDIALPAARLSDFPELDMGLYDGVVAFDHASEQAWVIACGYDAAGHRDGARAQACLEQRLAQLRPLVGRQFVASSPVQWDQPLQPLLSAATYQHQVKKAQDFILAGDIFEVNLSQCFSTALPAGCDHFALYQELMAHNPAPFSAYMHGAGYHLISASPERFLSLHQGQVEARPIKGTIRRSTDATQDAQWAAQLLASEKDRSENIMIVDLMRNDLSRVCDDASVQVTQLCGLESFATVHHLVSVVTGQLRPDQDAFDLLSASFPGGSITGAPKVRAMEIIAALEPVRRHAYCGSIGYISMTGDMDFSITIRTLLSDHQRLSAYAGGAVVLSSDPVEEYEETVLKMQALQRSLVGDLA